MNSTQGPLMFINEREWPFFVTTNHIKICPRKKVCDPPAEQEARTVASLTLLQENTWVCSPYSSAKSGTPAGSLSICSCFLASLRRLTSCSWHLIRSRPQPSCRLCSSPLPSQRLLCFST